MWGTTSYSAAESSRVAPPSVPARTHLKDHERLLLRAWGRARRVSMTLLRRVWLTLRAHPHAALGLSAAVMGCACLRFCRDSGERRCAPSAEDAGFASSGGWTLLWSWLPPFIRVIHPGSDETGAGCRRPWGGCGKDDDIDFVDATESAFRAFQRRVERTHMAPLLRTLDELEGLGERWRRRTGSHTAAGEEEDEEVLRGIICKKAIEADELLTQLIVQLDLAPVGDNTALKSERKASIVATAALAERIAAWMHLPPG